MNPKISVVIPCYNGSRYIEKCVKSLMAQSYTNLEIIIVNDGSTDDTEEKVAAFLDDPRIKYIKQENGGEAAARNTGIKASEGEFLGFVDIDDYVEPEMYSKLYAAIKENDADVAACNYNQIYHDETIKQNYSTMSGECFDIQEDVLSYWVKVCATARPNNYVWTRLYKRKLIIDSGVMFEQFIHSADTLFNFKLLPFVNKCVIVNEGLYNYVQHPGSGIHTVAIKRNIAELYADTFQALADYYKNFDKFKCVLPIHAYTRLKNVFFYSRLAGISDDEIIRNVSECWKDREIFQYFLGELF